MSVLAAKSLQMISLEVMVLISIVCKILCYKQSKKGEKYSDRCSIQKHMF